MNVHERSVEKRNIRPLLGGVARSAKTEARRLLELGSDPSRSTLDETSRVQIPHNGFIFCPVTVGQPIVSNPSGIFEGKGSMNVELSPNDRGIPRWNGSPVFESRTGR